VLTAGAGEELVPEREDAVTGEDIVDKLLFMVRILKECDEMHALRENFLDKGYKKRHTVGLQLLNMLKRTRRR